MYMMKNQELKLTYCPTANMIADFSTKLLQGGKFIEFWDKILGIRAADFKQYKKKYTKVLNQYNLYENKEDLFDI